MACSTVQSLIHMFELEKYNDLKKSLRIVGYVLRFKTTVEIRN